MQTAWVRVGGFSCGEISPQEMLSYCFVVRCLIAWGYSCLHVFFRTHFVSKFEEAKRQLLLKSLNSGSSIAQRLGDYLQQLESKDKNTLLIHHFAEVRGALNICYLLYDISTMWRISYLVHNFECFMYFLLGSMYHTHVAFSSVI